jgi:hypothetical protein
MAAVRTRAGRRELAGQNIVEPDARELGDAKDNLSRHGPMAIGDVAQPVTAEPEHATERRPAPGAEMQEVKRPANVGLFLVGKVCAHDASPGKLGSIPSSNMACTRHERLWQSALQRTSFTWATGLLLRTEPPNFRLIALNVLSTFERAW